MNKTCTYILPLFCKFFYIENGNLMDKHFLSYMNNCYCYRKINKSTKECFIIKFEEPDEFDEIFEDFIGNLEKSSIFACTYMIKDEPHIIIEFNIPDILMESFYNFINGKFSQISERDKRTILSFNRRYVSMERSVTINEIFNKSSIRRKSLEDSLDVKIPIHSELSSVPNKLDETLILNKLYV